MVWYGMYDTPRRLKIPSLLFAFSISWLCIFVVLRGRDPFRDEWTLPMTPRKCASIPLGPLQCEQPLNFHQETAYKRTFPGSRSSLSLSKRLQISRRMFVRLTDCRMQPILVDTDRCVQKQCQKAQKAFYSKSTKL